MKSRMCRSVRRRTGPILRVIALGMALILAASGATAAAASPGVIRVRNLMPDFWNFWRAARGEPPGVKLKLWRTLYQDPNSAVFAELKRTCGKNLRARDLETQYFDDPGRDLATGRLEAPWDPEAAGLVRDRHEGRQTHYSAQPGALAPLIDRTGRMAGFRQTRFDRLEDLLKRMDR